MRSRGFLGLGVVVTIGAGFAALDLEGLSVSSGSACSAGTNEPSPVLTAMHDEARAGRSVRLSLGESTTAEEVAFTVEALARVLARQG